MTLGEIIKKYREDNSLSMGEFADLSGLSKAYISILEKNQHPRTGRPVAPSIQSIRLAAEGMGMSFDTLFGMIDGNIIINDDSQSIDFKRQHLVALSLDEDEFTPEELKEIMEFAEFIKSRRK